MAQTLEEQIITIERSLGERMISHALVIVRSWLNELGENNPYEQAFDRLNNQYTSLFDSWLTSDSSSHDETLDRLTGDAYRLVDEVVIALRLYRGLSPTISAFAHDNPQSVMHYFANCLRLQPADFDWLRTVMNTPDKSALALMAIAALAKNVRESFSETAIMTLIDGISSENSIVAEQCLANTIILLAHYDVRIDYFPDLQNAFVAAIDELGDDGEQPFATLSALVRTANPDPKNARVERHEVSVEDLPKELQSLLELTGHSDNVSSIMAWLPASEQEYMRGLVLMLPDTWVYSVIVGDSTERAGKIAMVYLSIGYMDMLWDRTDVAAQWLLQQLREGSQSPKDYINYGHCLLLQGDRMMAYENYRQARQLCSSSKDFYALFRPDRRALVDRGIPIEHIYLIEDQLLKS